MGLIVSNKGGKDFEPVSAGVHLAVCYSIVDLGSTFSEMYQKWTRKVLIAWETADETITMQDEQGNDVERRRVVSKRYTPSLHEKSNMRQDLVSWRGKDFAPEEEEAFDLHNVLGVTCQLNIVHETKNNKTYANVRAVIPAPKGTRLKPENEQVAYDIDFDGANIPESLPDWIKDIIRASPEYKAITNPDDGQSFAGEGEPVLCDDDQIPF